MVGLLSAIGKTSGVSSGLASPPGNGLKPLYRDLDDPLVTAEDREGLANDDPTQEVDERGASGPGDEK